MSASIPTSARTIVLQNYIAPECPLDVSSSPSGTFTVKELPLPSPLPDGSLLVQILYFGNDTTARMLLSKDIKYQHKSLVKLPLGAPVPTPAAIARVLKVGGNVGKEEVEQFKAGDITRVMWSNWADYAVVKKSAAKRLRPLPGVSLSTYLGALGHTGYTVYWSFKDVLKPKQTDTLVVSGAAGATGNVAVQYAKKVLGVKRVVGIAGSDEKCNWVKSIGADEAVNYKSPTFVEDLAKATPEPVDLFFDTVGGNILDEVLMRMKPHGTICLIGNMATMEKFEEPVVMKNYAQIFVNRLTLKGFTISDYYDRLPEAEETLAKAVAAGKLVIEGAEMVVDVHGNIEELPRVWKGLFTGANTGKLITKVAD